MTLLFIRSLLGSNTAMNRSLVSICWLLFCQFCVSLAPPSSAAAEPWNRFRGPNGSGADNDVPALDLAATEPSWRVELPGRGHGSPVVWQDRILVTSGDTHQATQHVVCIDASIGKIVWQRSFPLAGYSIHERNSFASASAAVDDQGIYVAWANPTESTLTALGHDGSLRWQTPLGTFTTQHGFATSPILHRDLVILNLSEEKPESAEQPPGAGSRLVAIDRSTGTVRWSTPRATEVTSYSVPCLYTHPDGREELIGCSTADGLYSVNPRTGAPNWSLPVFEKRTVSSPLVAAGLIFGTTGSGGGGSLLVAVDPTATPPRVVYELRKQVPYVPTPVARGNLLFLWSDRGIVTCLRAASGEQLWQERVGGNFSASPVVGGESLYSVDDDGVLWALSATERFTVLGKFACDDVCRSSPALAHGRLYVRTQSRLLAWGSMAP